MSLNLYAPRARALSAARRSLLASSMLSGFGPLLKREAPRKSWITFVKPVALAATFGMFATGAAFAQTTVAPANGQGSVTYTGTATVTDNTGANGGFLLNGAPQTVTFGGLQISVPAPNTALGIYSSAPLTVTETAPSSLSSGQTVLELTSDGSIDLTTAAGTINNGGASAIFGIYASGTGTVSIDSSSVITADYGIIVNNNGGGAINVTTRAGGTIDGGGYAINTQQNSTGVTHVTVGGAIGATARPGEGVYLASTATGNTVAVNANVSATDYGVDAFNTVTTDVSVASGVTVNAGIEALRLLAGNVVNRGAVTSGTGGDAVFAFGALNLVNAGTINAQTTSGVVAGSGSTIVNAASGAIQGGTDANYGYGVQAAANSGVINNYGSITGTAGGITVNQNLAAGTGVAINLFAGSTTGAIAFGSNTGGSVTVYNGTGTSSAGVTDATTGVVLQAAGTNAAATVGTITGPYALTLRGTGDDTAANGAAGSIAAPGASATSLTKLDSGVWNLTGTGTYTGPTTIAAGTLALSGSASIASSSGVALTGSTSILDLTGINAFAGSTISNLSGVANSQVRIGSKGLTVNQSTNATFAGILSGTSGLPPFGGSLNKSGAGALTLTGANTYSGTVAISAGTLALGGAGTFTAGSFANSGVFDISGHTGGASVVGVSGSGAVTLGANTLTLTGASGTISGVISGAGGGLTVSAGTETLTGANTYTGATTIAAGAGLTLGAGGDISYSSGVAANGALDVSGVSNGYTLIQGLTGASTGTVALGATYLEVSTPLNFAGVISGTGSLQVDNGPASQLGVFAATNTGVSILSGDNTYTGTTQIAGTLRLGAGGTTGSVAGRINLGATTSILNINRSNALTLSQLISGTGRLVQSGTGTTTLTLAETYTGLTQVTGGRLALTGAGSIAASQGVSANGVFDISGVTAATSTIKTLSGFGSVVLGAKTLVLNGAGGFTFSGAVSGTGGLTVTGTGVNGLGGVNTYSGATIINAGGGLALNGAGSIAASSGLQANGTFSIAGKTGDATIKALTGSGSIQLGANRLAIVSTNSSFSGVISGSGGLDVGAGLTLSGANTYTGSTNIFLERVLSLTGAGSIANSAVIANGTFDISGHSGDATIAALSGSGFVTLGANTLALSGGSGSFGGQISGSGGLTLLGGSETLTGVSNYTGATNIAGGTLIFGSGGSVGSSPISLTAAGATLDVTAQPGFNLGAISGVSGSFVNATGLVTLGSDASTTFASNLTTTGGLTKIGSGSLLLSGSNSFNGPTTVSAGVLAVSGGSAISDNSVVNIASGAGFSVLGSETVANIGGAGQIGLASGAALTFGGDNQASSFGAFSGAGDLVKTGTGVFTLAGVNGSTGRTTISGGQILMTAGGGFAGSVAVGSGASLTGTGSVNGNLTVASGGTLSPGANPGDFATISAGSLNTAGTIRIDFGGNSTGSKSDKIIVAGAINVAGGMIDAHPTSATNDYTFNQYFALTAGTTFTGQFTNPTDFTTNAYDPRLKQRIRYDLGPAAVLEVRFLQDLTAGLPADGSGGNAGSVALALNGTESGASDAFSVLINALADLSPAARTKALQLLSGEGAVDGQQLASVGFDGFMGVLSSHLADAGDGSGSAAAFGLFDAQGGGSSRFGGLRARSNQQMLGMGAGIGLGSWGRDRAIRTWAQGFAVDRTLDANGGFAATTTTGEGFAAGVDAAFGHGITAGAAIGYSNPRSKTSDRNAKADGDSTFGGAYAKWTQGAWFAGVQAGYGSTDLSLQRTVQVGALSFAPRGKTSADSYGVGFSAGYRHVLSDGSRLDPIVTVEYAHDGQDAYSETNGGVAGLRFASVDLDRVTATAGARWAKDYSYRGWRITPDARLAAALAGGDLNINTGAAFLAAPSGTGAFRVSGAKTPPSWGIVEAGVSFAPRDSKLDFKVGYEGDYGSRLTEHHLAATIGYRW